MWHALAESENGSISERVITGKAIRPAERSCEALFYIARGNDIAWFNVHICWLVRTAQYRFGPPRRRRRPRRRMHPVVRGAAMDRDIEEQLSRSTLVACIIIEYALHVEALHWALRRVQDSGKCFGFCSALLQSMSPYLEGNWSWLLALGTRSFRPARHSIYHGIPEPHGSCMWHSSKNTETTRENIAFWCDGHVLVPLNFRISIQADYKLHCNVSAHISRNISTNGPEHLYWSSRLEPIFASLPLKIDN